MAHMSQARYLPHNKHPPTEREEFTHAQTDIEDELVFSVDALHRQTTSKHGVYLGAPGFLLMDWTVADTIRNLSDGRSDALTPPKPNLYSYFPFQKPVTGGRTAFLETDVGAATLILVSDLRDGLLDVKGGTDRSRAAAILVREAIELAVDGNDPKDDDGCEVLYGRAGLLYAMLFLRAEISNRRNQTSRQPPADAFVLIVAQLCHEQNVGALVDEIVARGRRGAKLYAREARGHEQEELNAPALMWSWHGKRYLGGAHGVAGILQMLVSAPDASLTRHWDAIVETVQWLVDIQERSGNWPHKVTRDMLVRPDHHPHIAVEDADEMVQWCHGAPGMLILFSTLLRQRDARTLYIPDSLDSALQEALAKGGELVYERGLLRKGLGLCHGVAGSVYALLAVSDVLDGHPPSSGSRTPTQLPPQSNGRSTRSRSAQMQQQQEHPAPSAHHAEDRKWFLRAIHIAHLATAYRKLTQRREMRTPDRPYSLYEGLAGMCCAWAEVLKRSEGWCATEGTGAAVRRRGMPGYDDLSAF